MIIIEYKFKILIDLILKNNNKELQQNFYDYFYKRRIIKDNENNY